jgi:hypothetical protein
MTPDPERDRKDATLRAEAVGAPAGRPLWAGPAGVTGALVRLSGPSSVAQTLGGPDHVNLWRRSRWLPYHTPPGKAEIEQPSPVDLAVGIRDMFETAPDKSWRDHIAAVADDLASGAAH